MVASNKKKDTSRILRSKLIALFIFLLLSALTLLVWKRQVDNQRSLLSRHTKDMCVQSAQRLQTFMEFHLKMARIFAIRWATHETRDFSKIRFEEFARVVIQELPGYAALAIVPADQGPVWKIPQNNEFSNLFVDTKVKQTILDLSLRAQPSLSEPFVSNAGRLSFDAVLPLLRENELLGHLVVFFHVENIMIESFHDRIRTEFNFTIEDGGKALAKSSSDLRSKDLLASPIVSQMEFPVQNRTWRLVVAPRADASAHIGWMANLSVPLLGLVFSLGLSFLVYLISERMEMYLSARDEALREIEERKKAVEALQLSEERYRNVFNSATDGFLVLEPDGTIVEANPAAGEMHGCNASEIIGRPVQELLAPDERHRLDHFRQELERHTTAKLDTVGLRRDGKMIDIEVRGARLKQGDRIRFLAIINDVTERKKTMERQALLSRKVILAQEEERGRLSMELHDELGQLLTALRLEMGLISREINGKALAPSAILDTAVQLNDQATSELRRICRGLRPPLLDDLGLEPALELLVNEFRERAEAGISIDCSRYETATEISPEISLCAYRILQESLNNIVRHSRAKNVSVALSNIGETLSLTVHDDGIGFDMDALRSLKGCGLEGMRERANLVDGVLEVRSLIGQGTRITLRAPLLRLNKKEVA